MTRWQSHAQAQERLAVLVRTRRAKKGWSQSMLADAAQTSRDVIKRLESGRSDARLSVLITVLPVLGVTSQDLRQLFCPSTLNPCDNPN